MLFYPIRAGGQLSALFQSYPNLISLGISDGILLRECDGGTAWNEVKTGDCPLTSPTEGIQVSWILGQYHSHCSIQ